MTSNNLRPGAIARYAADLRTVYLAHNFAVVAMLHPSTPLHRFALDLTDSHEYGDTPLRVDAPGDTEINFSAREVLTAATNIDQEMVRDLMMVAAVTAGLRLGDAIKNGGYRDYGNPLLEFARHYRNACAHGGDWDIRENKKHGWNPAILRDLELSPDLHGKRAVWGTVTPYLHLVFLNEIRAYFDTVALQRALTSTWEAKRAGSRERTDGLLMENLQAQGVSSIDDRALRKLAWQLDLGHLPEPVVQREEYVPSADN